MTDSPLSPPVRAAEPERKAIKDRLPFGEHPLCLAGGDMWVILERDEDGAFSRRVAVVYDENLVRRILASPVSAERPSEPERRELLSLLVDIGLTKDATVASVQRRLHVGAADAMRLLALKESIHAQAPVSAERVRLQALEDELDTLCMAVEGHRGGALTNDGLWHYVVKARKVRLTSSSGETETNS